MQRLGSSRSRRGDADLRAAFAYFAIVFALGFVLGTVRVLVAEPRIGITAATLIELPVMLSASWLACGWVIRRLALPRRGRWVMGAVALALLLLGELGVSTLLMGRGLPEHFATYERLPNQIGLAAQLAFAVFPLVRR